MTVLAGTSIWVDYLRRGASGSAAADAGAALWSRDPDFARIGGVLDDLERFEA